MNTTIPKRIIQTDKSLNLPPLSKAAVSSVKLHNPDFEYLFFDDLQVEEFIDMQFPEYRSVFDMFPFKIQRYDFFRYLVIYRFGGFYFDTDVVLSSNLNDLLEYGCVFPFERLTWSDFLRKEYGMDWEIGNYGFGAAAGHPFIRAIIENCVRAQTDKKWREAITNSLPRLLRQELFVIYSTGPGLVSRTLAEYPSAADQVKVLFHGNVCDKKNCWNLFGKYGVHLGGGSWRTQHGFVGKRLINYLGIQNEKQAIEYARTLGESRSLERLKSLPTRYASNANWSGARFGDE